MTKPATTTVPSVEGGNTWRCFHCDDVFTDISAAEEHFGSFCDCIPACKIGVEQYRKMEKELENWRAGNDGATKEFYSLGSKHATELRREEERGYERGLRDGMATPLPAVAVEQDVVERATKIMRAVPNYKVGEEKPIESYFRRLALALASSGLLSTDPVKVRK
jgi:hypothetical protein